MAMTSSEGISRAAFDWINRDIVNRNFSTWGGDSGKMNAEMKALMYGQGWYKEEERKPKSIKWI